jgi:hypothetical protein
MSHLLKRVVLGISGLAVAVVGLGVWRGAELTNGRTVASAAESQTPNRAGAPFAVVELFTSQGCSSCPSADKNLTRIIADAERRGINVLALSFHVDYWNRLGWKDPYSEAAWTTRQSTYAQAFEAEGVYTPQMVVNGTEQFVGSDVEQSDRVIAESLAKEPTGAALTLHAGQKTAGQLRVDYELSGAQAGESLIVVLARDSGTKDVTRGENAGRKLTHRNIVRSLQRVAAPTGRGTVDVKLATDTTGTPHRLIAFLQNNDTLAIRAAATIEVKP